MLTQMKRLQINQCVDRILNAPGNQVKSGMVLEMAVVLDESCGEKYILELSSELAASLKAHADIFQNVRCNVIRWGAGEDICTEIMPLAFVQLGKAVPRICEGMPRFDSLTAYLKLYHARCRLVLVLTKGAYRFGNPAACMDNLTPFLKRKLLLVQDEELITGSQLYLKLCENG